MIIIKLIILKLYDFKYNYCNVCDIIDNYYDNIINNINYKYITITMLQYYKLIKVSLNITDMLLSTIKNEDDYEVDNNMLLNNYQNYIVRLRKVYNEMKNKNINIENEVKSILYNKTNEKELLKTVMMNMIIKVNLS